MTRTALNLRNVLLLKAVTQLRLAASVATKGVLGRVNEGEDNRAMQEEIEDWRATASSIEKMLPGSGLGVSGDRNSPDSASMYPKTPLEVAMGNVRWSEDIGKGA
jgi:hypothetical protein